MYSLHLINFILHFVKILPQYICTWCLGYWISFSRAESETNPDGHASSIKLPKRGNSLNDAGTPYESQKTTDWNCRVFFQNNVTRNDRNSVKPGHIIFHTGLFQLHLCTRCELQWRPGWLRMNVHVHESRLYTNNQNHGSAYPTLRVQTTAPQHSRSQIDPAGKMKSCNPNDLCPNYSTPMPKASNSWEGSAFTSALVTLQSWMMLNNA